MSKLPYNGWLDLARIVAFLGVLWIHSPESSALREWTVLGRFAVPFFTAAAAYLAADVALRRPQQSWWRYVRDRSGKLYGMLLVWSIIYFSFRVLGYSCGVAKDPRPLVSWAILIRGTAPHLWFLPFIAFGIAVAFGVARLTSQSWQKLMAVAFGLAGLWPALVPLSGFNSRWGYTVQLGYQASAALAWGLALRLWSDPANRSPTRRHGLAVSMAVIVIAGVVAVTGARQVWAENLWGTALLTAALTAPAWNATAMIRRAGELTFGAYIVHLLPVDGLQGILQKWGVPKSSLTDLVVYVGAGVATVGLCLALEASPQLRWLVNSRRRN